jgi:hypothetical protein
MAGKSRLDGAASQVYETCYGSKCDQPARKAVVLTSIDQKGSDVDIVPLCHNCAKKATKNAKERGLSSPRSTRLTKKVAQDFRQNNAQYGSDTKPINPNKYDIQKSKGLKVHTKGQPNLGKGPEAMTRAHTIMINQLDPERAMPINAVDSDTPIGRAYRARNLEVAKRRRTPEQRKAIIDEARKGGRLYE